jgi:hypothetical protein
VRLIWRRKSAGERRLRGQKTFQPLKISGTLTSWPTRIDFAGTLETSLRKVLAPAYAYAYAIFRGAFGQSSRQLGSGFQILFHQTVSTWIHFALCLASGHEHNYEFNLKTPSGSVLGVSQRLQQVILFANCIPAVASRSVLPSISLRVRNGRRLGYLFMTDRRHVDHLAAVRASSLASIPNWHPKIRLSRARMDRPCGVSHVYPCRFFSISISVSISVSVIARSFRHT